jgi:hypothetical protein
MKIEFSPQFFEKSSNIKFHENSSIGGRVVPFGRTDRRTDVPKLIAIRNTGNATNNEINRSMALAVSRSPDCQDLDSIPGQYMQDLRWLR